MSEDKSSPQVERSKADKLARQKGLPVSIDGDGNLLTLGQVMSPTNAKYRSVDELSAVELMKVALGRIEKNPDFKVGFMSAGVVDQKRAIKEITEGTEVGKVLLRTQYFLIKNLLEKVAALNPS